MFLEVFIDGVWLRTGPHTSGKRDGSTLMPSAAAIPSPDWAMLLHYPRAEMSWLTVGFTAGPATAPRASIGEVAEVDRLLLGYGASLERLRPGNQPDFAVANNFQCGMLRRNEPLGLEFSVNSDIKAFRDYVAKYLAEGERELNATLKGTMLNWKGAIREQEHFEIRLTMRPLQHLGDFPGVVAIDLGSTSSAIVALNTGWQLTQELLILSSAENNKGSLSSDRRSENIPSHVRFDKLTTWNREVYKLPPGTGPRPYEGMRKLPMAELTLDQLPLAVEWTVGTLADTASDRGGLVVGMKRLLASPTPEGTIDLRILHHLRCEETDDRPTVRRHETISVLHRFPAELMACRLMQWFSRAPLANGLPAGIPLQLALTYPTTWSPAEIDRLRRAVYRAWLRMRFRMQSSGLDGPSPDNHEGMNRIADRIQRQMDRREIVEHSRENPLVLLMLDEASAASFYFLYRRILEAPGGLPTFRYNYPDGLNMILYDCGGGTTDIALVRASCDPSLERVLNIDVRSRSGVRHFGGDDITAAICRLLKAKIGRRILEDRASGVPGDKAPAEPQAPASIDSIASRLAARGEVERFLADMKKFDEESRAGGPLVPTSWAGRGFSEDKIRERADHTAVLWRWAEAFKKKLSEPPTPPATPPAAGAKPDPVRATFKDVVEERITPTSSPFAAALLSSRRGNPAQEKALGELIEGKVAIFRWEIDALIGSQVSRTVRNCNAMIQKQLVEASESVGKPPEELHLLVVTGNASRYPLIEEMLRERLAIDDLSMTGRLEMDLDNMKNAVAKGAALWLSTQIGRGTVRIRTDSDLCECLPCDIGYLMVTSNKRKTLYPVQTRFDTLLPIPIALVDAVDAREFSLERRFPGDGVGHKPEEDGAPTDLERNEGWSKFVTFRFGEPIVSPLTVSYDREKHDFAVTDRAGNEGKAIETESGDIHKSPMQRGDI